MRHVADMSKAVQCDEAAQAFRLMGRRDAILEPDHDLGWRLRRREKAADVDRLATARQNSLGEAALIGDQWPLSALAQRGPGERRAQRGGIGRQHMQPGRESRLSVGLQKAVEESGVGLRAKPRRRDQHQRQRLDARLMREGGGHGAAKRVPDEVRGADPLLYERGARRFDQGREARFLAERRQSVARQVDRQRWERLGQKAMNGPPAVEIGAEAVQENDRRTLPSLQPQPMHVRRQRPSSAALLDVAPLDASTRAGPVHALEPQAALPRHSSSRRRGARTLADHFSSLHRASGRTPVFRRAMGSASAFSGGGAKLSPSGTIQPMHAPTGSTSPSDAATNFNTPEAGASTSIAALSVSISNSVAPFSTWAPSAACQLPIRPDVMSMSTRGMTISTATGHTSPCARRRAAATMSSTCGTAALSRTGL